MTDRELIMMVDDEPVWLSSLARALSRGGYRTLPLDDPTRVLEAVSRERPAAMILDHSMPRMTGTELASLLRESLGDDCPPLVLVSGDLRHLDVETRALFAATFEKPVSLRVLLAELKRVIRGATASGTLRRPDAIRARTEAAREDDESAAG